MPQKTNLNISPYYDDFDKADNFYKILFKPGHPVQARELTGLQSVLQNQLESFGSHIFKEGSMVIPGNIEYDPTYFAAKVNPDHLGIDVSIYLDAIVNNNNGKGTRVRGQNSQIVATIKNYILPPEEGVDEITIFVKYITSGSSGESEPFPDGEILTLEENVTYGNTTLTAGETVLNLVPELATSTGSAFGVNTGVYFIRGTFVDVSQDTIVLEPYGNKPSYRVGFQIIEEIVNANDDPSLYDNAKGFTNYAAPGADRFKISVKLAKKALSDFEDTNFVELFRVKNGETKKLQDTSVYSEIKKYFAKRTFDESGNYAVKPFTVNLQNSLNDEVRTAGLFTEGQKTDDGNDPSEDLMCVKLSPGKAYVRGFDVYLPGTTVLDVDKPRDTKTIKNASVSYEMGSLLKVNNVHGTPFINIGGDANNVVGLFKYRKETNTVPGAAIDRWNSPRNEIGQARIYAFNTSDAPYTGASTEWDLYLWDIQTYTALTISNLDTNDKAGTRVRGLSSGAIGYLAKDAGSIVPTEILVTQTTGSFVPGESLIFNEKTTGTYSSILPDSASAKGINIFTVDDIKSVYQNSNAANSDIPVNAVFTADSVLYDRILPNFAPTDILGILGNNSNAATATCPLRRFSGKVGIKSESIISYQRGDFGDPVFNRVSNISADGATLTLSEVVDVAGVCEGDIPVAGVSTESTFFIKSPKITNLQNSGLFSPLPKRNVSSVDVSSASLQINRQILKQNANGNEISINSGAGLNPGVGISSAFFEPFDVERYSIIYENGTVEKLTSDQVTISNNGNDIRFNGLALATNNATVNVTLKKVGLDSKSKDYIRSEKVTIDKTAGVSTSGSLIQSNVYGVRVEDKEICLNVPDVAKVIAVYESKDLSVPTLDRLTFVSGLGLNTNTIVGEKILGNDSRAVGQVVNRISDTEVEFVYLNANKFNKGELATFKESNVEAVIQVYTSGNYTDRTTNYTLDSGHRAQYADYSRIVRKARSSAPSKKLLVIFNKYKIASGTTGDLFTANSYNKDRYTYDVPFVQGNRATDILDFRPRVKTYAYSANGGSPFAFKNRTNNFEETIPYVVAPNESSIVGYTYYLPRIDKLVINKFEEVKLIKGVSADEPAPPTELGDSMEVAQISLPPYLYDPIKQPNIRLYDNRRFTMRDIGNLEKRIINLETFTSLSALELDTKTLSIKDAQGNDRFKTGFVVNNFKNRDFIDFNREDGSRCDVNTSSNELISAVDFWSLRAELGLNPGIDPAQADLSSNLDLLDPNCKKTGDLITLDYTEVDWIDQPQATQVENINPFNVIVFVGGVMLDPPSDNWVRTIYVDDHRTESSGAEWAQVANVVNQNVSNVANSVDTVDTNVVTTPAHGRHEWVTTTNVTNTTTTTTTTTETETEFINQLNGPSREFDYVESVKVSGETDPFMRSRNVYFAANGLKPFTKHYQYLDSGVPDVFPKLVEISMTSGAFTVFENAKIELNGTQIGYIRVQKPNHKFGDTSRPDIAAGLGSPSVVVEEYSVDPFDRDRPAPSTNYSATSKIFNTDVSALANQEQYFGYIVKDATIIGETSGAVATVTSVDLNSDNWGDLLGAFFFRNSNVTPQPSVLFFSGTKTFRVTAAPPGTLPLPGSTVFASDASGVYSGSGTILTQETSTVGVRNPPPPAQKPNETTTSVNVNVTTAITNIDTSAQLVKVPHRDPLAQSFRVDESGAFLTSFDVYFGSKDPNAKVFVELRTVELGTPTSFLVQDFAQVALNPNNINVSADASVPTTVRFPSPVYLEPETEYAIVFLSPGSDLYEMWVATMGQKTVKSSNLPDVQDVVVSKQYIGGSLFKSQNGTIWTASQYQDLTFKLRKAEFVPSGTVTFYNSDVGAGYNTQVLSDNPIRTLPRKLRVKLAGSNTNTATELAVGRKVSTDNGTGNANSAEDISITGIIEARGAALASATSFEIVSAGEGYVFSGNVTSKNSIPLVSLTGDGTGMECSVNAPNGIVASNGITNLTHTAGSGYVVGEVLTIDNSDTDVTGGSGFKMVVTAVSNKTDTIYLTDVQGDHFTANHNIVEYGAGKDTRAMLANCTVASTQSTASVVNGDLNTGNIFEVIQPNHAHHGITNKIEIKDVKPDTPLVQTTADLDTAGQEVTVSDVKPFTQVSGIATDRGEAIIGEEIVAYTVGVGKLTLSKRGASSTPVLPHPSGSDIQVYEAGGVPLSGINTTFSISNNATLRSNSNIDNYYLEVNRTSLDTLTQRTGNALLCFTSDKAVGGNNVGASQNHQFSTFSPQFNVITPGKTKVSTSVRTVSGTSSGGNEVSFIDQGFEPTTLNETTFFPTPRLVASKINQAEYLSTLPRNKSLSVKVDMVSTDVNLSPVLDVQNATFILGRNKINNPIGRGNYATDTKSLQTSGDPHGSIFISNPISLQQPATSLKVLLAASVQPEADFRVFYRLFTADSTEVSQSYRAFPGYKNLRDTNGDGFGDQVIDISLNDGSADSYVVPNRINEFSEYQFSVDDLEQFSGFTVKIVMTSTNECVPVRIKDFRAIALA